MSNKNKVTVSSVDANRKMVRFVESGVRLIEHSRTCLSEGIGRNKNKSEIGKYYVLYELLNSLEESCGSLICLSRDGMNNIPKGHWNLRDIYIISRSVFEIVINCLFIVAKGDETVEKATAHYMQKVNRNTKRNLKIGEFSVGLEYFGRNSFKELDGFEKAMKDYTSKHGKEKNAWTEESIVKKLEDINKQWDFKSLRVLQCALLFFYGDATEISHGTFYGSMFLKGYDSPNIRILSAEDDLIRNGERLFVLLFHIEASILSLVEIFISEFKLIDLDTKKISLEYKRVNKDFFNFISE